MAQVPVAAEVLGVVLRSPAPVLAHVHDQRFVVAERYRRGDEAKARHEPILVLGPAQDDPTLAFPVADYAIAHPPEKGRIVTYAGVGSYINWRSPSTRVVMNGWLEHYTPQQLQDNYGILRAWTPDLRGALKRTHAGAVITHVHTAIRRLEADGLEFKR